MAANTFVGFLLFLSAPQSFYKCYTIFIRFVWIRTINFLSLLHRKLLSGMSINVEYITPANTSLAMRTIYWSNVITMCWNVLRITESYTSESVYGWRRRFCSAKVNLNRWMIREMIMINFSIWASTRLLFNVLFTFRFESSSDAFYDDFLYGSDLLLILVSQSMIILTPRIRHFCVKINQFSRGGTECKNHYSCANKWKQKPKIPKSPN